MTPKDKNGLRPLRLSNPKNRTRIELEYNQDITKSGTEQEWNKNPKDKNGLSIEQEQTLYRAKYKTKQEF